MRNKQTDNKGLRANNRKVRPSVRAGEMDFSALVAAIRATHEQCAAAVSRTVNLSLTVRNWTIGGYIHHYELHGKDRAAYGESLIDTLAGELNRHGITACDRQRLYGYLAFFRAYPQIGDVIPGQPSFAQAKAILRSAIGQSEETVGKAIVRSATGQLGLAGNVLLERLAYTHLDLLTAVEDPLKRAFYEIECVRGNWSVRQLSHGMASTCAPKATSLRLACCSARAKTMPLSSTPWQPWTTGYSSQSTNWNSQVRINWFGF
jgi:hypothetical protein